MVRWADMGSVRRMVVDYSKAGMVIRMAQGIEYGAVVLINRSMVDGRLVTVESL